MYSGFFILGEIKDTTDISVAEPVPYPVVFPELVLGEDGWGDIAPLVLFSSLLHRFLVALLSLKRQF